MSEPLPPPSGNRRAPRAHDPESASDALSSKPKISASSGSWFDRTAASTDSIWWAKCTMESRPKACATTLDGVCRTKNGINNFGIGFAAFEGQ